MRNVALPCSLTGRRLEPFNFGRCAGVEPVPRKSSSVRPAWLAGCLQSLGWQRGLPAYALLVVTWVFQLPDMGWPVKGQNSDEFFFLDCQSIGRASSRAGRVGSMATG